MVYRESSVPQMVMTSCRPGALCPDTAPFEPGAAAPTASNFGSQDTWHDAAERVSSTSPNAGAGLRRRGLV
jgi:hypothetical protein